MGAGPGRSGETERHAERTGKEHALCSFIGAHQAVNAAVAAMALTILMKEDGRINENDLREGLARARWQGRFEIHHAGGKQLS